MFPKQIYDFLKKSDSPSLDTSNFRCERITKDTSVCMADNATFIINYGGWKGSCDCDEYYEERTMSGMVDGTHFSSKGSVVTYELDRCTVMKDLSNNQ
jgi:hypothetical protein